jgi:hypothetical protein
MNNNDHRYSVVGNDARIVFRLLATVVLTNNDFQLSKRVSDPINEQRVI